MSLSSFPPSHFRRVVFSLVLLSAGTELPREIVVFDRLTNSPVAHFPFSGIEEPFLEWRDESFVFSEK